MALVWLKSIFYPSLFPGGVEGALYCGLKQLSGLSMAMAAWAAVGPWVCVPLGEEELQFKMVNLQS